MNTYRDFLIYPTDPLPPIPTWRQFRWTFVHPDFDGAEDSGDRRCGHGSSIEDCIHQIDDLLEMAEAA